MSAEELKYYVNWDSGFRESLGGDTLSSDLCNRDPDLDPARFLDLRRKKKEKELERKGLPICSFLSFCERRGEGR